MIYNIRIIGFSDYFKDNIERTILNNLHKLNCVENHIVNLNQTLTKRIIYVHIIQQLLKHIQSEGVNVDKSIFVVQPDIIDVDVETASYSNLETFRKIVQKVLYKFAKLYPDRILFLKEYMDLSSSDTLIYLFDKSNRYIKNSPKDISNFALKQKLKVGVINAY